MGLDAPVACGVWLKRAAQFRPSTPVCGTNFADTHLMPKPFIKNAGMNRKKFQVPQLLP
jgi:hypothetical protein